MEGTRQENSQPMRSQQKTSCHRSIRRRARLLRNGSCKFLIPFIKHLQFFVCLSFKLSIVFATCFDILCLLFQSGQLNEYTERKEMSSDVVCMALASVPSGEQRSRFLAVGLADNTVRIISLDPTVSQSYKFFFCFNAPFTAQL